MKDRYLTVQDVMEITGKKTSWSSNLIRKLNDELKEKGFLISRGRIPKNYFCKRLGLDPEDFN